MPFGHILAQTAAVTTLSRALESGRVHHAYRFEGPDGVGKELAGFAFAQALVCTAGAPLGCGTCDACRRAVTLSEQAPHVPLHPDVRVVGRGVYPPEAIGRSRQELTEISVDQIRRIVLAHAAFPPHEGKARVFIVRQAEELSISAANALLKTLEEPRKLTHFVLLSSRPDRLLPTIRSRTLPIRFAPLPEAALETVLTAHGVPADRHALAMELAGGSASAALAVADADRNAAQDEFVAAVLAAASARDLGPAVALAESREAGRDQVRADLRALSATLAWTARAAALRDPDEAVVAARRYDATLRALDRLDRNASPSLTLVQLVADMR